MTSLIYEPHTIEYPACADCCIQFPVIYPCNSLFPNGVAQCWELVGVTQSLIGTCSLNSCRNLFDRTWTLRWDYHPKCNPNLVERNIISCRTNCDGGWGVTGYFNFGLCSYYQNNGCLSIAGFELCIVTTFPSNITLPNFTPPTPGPYIVLNGAYSPGFIGGIARYRRMYWYIDIADFNPLGYNELIQVDNSFIAPPIFNNGCRVTMTIEPKDSCLADDM